MTITNNIDPFAHNPSVLVLLMFHADKAATACIQLTFDDLILFVFASDILSHSNLFNFLIERGA